MVLCQALCSYLFTIAQGPFWRNLHALLGEEMSPRPHTCTALVESLCRWSPKGPQPSTTSPEADTGSQRALSTSGLAMGGMSPANQIAHGLEAMADKFDAMAESLEARAEDIKVGIQTLCGAAYCTVTQSTCACCESYIYRH